jgi:hypothetical protein
MQSEPDPTGQAPRRRVSPPRGVDPFGDKRGRGRRGHFKVEDLLRVEDRDAYYAFLRVPTTTHETAHQWLRDRGYDVGIDAVRSHRVEFRSRLEAVREAAEMSYVCAELARQTGKPVLADGAVTRFETLLAQALFKLNRGGDLNRGQWDMLGRALNSAVKNRKVVEELHGVLKRQGAGSAAPEAGDGKTVVERVKEILGV